MTDDASQKTLKVHTTFKVDIQVRVVLVTWISERGIGDKKRTRHFVVTLSAHIGRLVIDTILIVCCIIGTKAVVAADASPICVQHVDAVLATTVFWGTVYFE